MQLLEHNSTLAQGSELQAGLGLWSAEVEQFGTLWTNSDLADSGPNSSSVGAAPIPPKWGEIRAELDQCVSEVAKLGRKWAKFSRDLKNIVKSGDWSDLIEMKQDVARSQLASRINFEQRLSNYRFLQVRQGTSKTHATCNCSVKLTHAAVVGITGTACIPSPMPPIGMLHHLNLRAPWPSP